MRITRPSIRRSFSRSLHARGLLAASLALLVLFPRPASGQTSRPESASRAPREDGAILASAEYRLRPYDSLSARQREDVDRETLRADYDAAQRETEFVLRRVLYGSDGLSVVAYTYGPRVIAAGDRRPIVVFARGSAVAGDLAPALAPRMRHLARAGFVVVAPQYRGSDGGEGRDEVGGADVADVHNAIRLARRLPGVDTAQVYLYGESRGGMMVYQVLRDGARVRAAAVIGAFTDLDSLLDADRWSRESATTVWPNYARDAAAIAGRRSALRWPERIQTPLLILHGGADPQVSPRHSLLLAAQLDARRVPYELHILAGAGHTLVTLGEDRERMVSAWFRRWATPRDPG
jgi:dipeptidyl aminopeptidase/acylaminoacyl peptidase